MRTSQLACGAAKPALGFVPSAAAGRRGIFSSFSSWVLGVAGSGVKPCSPWLFLSFVAGRIGALGSGIPPVLRRVASENLVEGSWLRLRRQLFNWGGGNVAVPMELNVLRIRRGIQILTWEPLLQGCLLDPCWFSSPAADGGLEVD